MGTMIEFGSNGGTTPGYLAEPAAGQSNGAGVVVIQEWWGLVPHIQEVADRFADHGFLALAPDLYHGKKTTRPDEAGRLLMGLDADRAGRDLIGAANFLRGRGAAKVGTVGFCMGGYLALYAATLPGSELCAVVDFYGATLPHVKPAFANLTCPVLGLFGEQDGSISKAQVESLGRAIVSAGGSFDHTTYPGAQHAFFNDHRPEVYDSEAAADAWRKTVGFLTAQLC